MNKNTIRILAGSNCHRTEVKSTERGDESAESGETADTSRRDDSGMGEERAPRVSRREGLRRRGERGGGGGAQRRKDAATDPGRPMAFLAFRFCAASLRESWTSRTVVTLLLLGLGLALAGSLWLGRPLGCFARSASASVARHFVPFQEDIYASSMTYWHFIGCVARNTLG